MASLSDRPSSQVLNHRYQLQKRLGKKAGRQTWSALDLKTQELVVVKLLTFSSDISWDDLKLFEREAEALQVLSHPAIPCYLDFFEVESAETKGFALVQTYINAPSLEQVLQEQGKVSESEVKRIVIEVLQILSYLHDRNPPVIHRDIKPGNILLIATDQVRKNPNQSPWLYLVDFGSVQTLATRDGKTATVVGTYGYMPPEQFGGLASPASDLYSLGATAIALLTGIPPSDLPQKNLRIQFEQFANVSPAFADWLKRMTQPTVSQRFASAAKALEALTDGSRSFKQEHYPIQLQGISSAAMLKDAISRGAIWGTLITFFCGGFFFVMIPLALPGILLAGALLGAVNGLLASILTRLWFFPLRDRRLHRWVVSLTCAIVCTGVTVIALKQWSTIDQYAFQLIGSIPVVLASPFMGVVSDRIIVGWHKRNKQALKSI
jgi:hypothetical protein